MKKVLVKEGSVLITTSYRFTVCVTKDILEGDECFSGYVEDIIDAECDSYAHGYESDTWDVESF